MKTDWRKGRIAVVSVGLLAMTGLLRPAPANAAWYERPRPQPAFELTLAEAQDPAVWTVQGDLAPVEDARTGGPALAVGAKGATVRSVQTPGVPCEISVLVRFAETARVQTVTLDYGYNEARPQPKSVYQLLAQANTANTRGGGAAALSVIPHLGAPLAAAYQNPAAVQAGGLNAVRTPGRMGFRPRFLEISPVWEPGFRTEIEAAMSALPRVTERWTELRIVHTRGWLRMYRDGTLVAERLHPAPADGSVALTVQAGMTVGRFAVRTLASDEAESPFVPVALDLLANADGARPDAGGFGVAAADLPPGGERVVVDGKPFVFPRGSGAHVDVGESLFHYRNQAGHYMARATWPDVTEMDPARLRVTVPNRPYQRLWLIAAHDGAPFRVPVITARFYKPHAGFPIDAAGAAPAFTATAAAGARRLPVKGADGRAGSLWLFGIDLDAVAIGSEFRDLPYLSLELTKQVHGFRSYPDPADYSWFQGGPASGVRVFALTLEQAPVRLLAGGNRHGHVYVTPEQPVWQVDLDNLSPRALPASVALTVRDPFGAETKHRLDTVLNPGGQNVLRLPLEARGYGLHEVTTEVALDGGRAGVLRQAGRFAQLPVDERLASPVNSRWGLWNWNGGHDTNPNVEENHYLNRAAGSRFTRGESATRKKWGMAHSPQHLLYGPEKWSLEDEVDPAAREAFAEEIGRKAARMYEKDPDTVSFSIFTETAISAPLTYGIPPEYLGEGRYEMNEAERRRFRGMTRTFEAAVEGIRRHAPKAPIALAWCEPNFTAPFLEAGVDKKMFEWIGVDTPIFERLPEMPIREVTPNRMWLLKQNLAKYGYADVRVIHTESYFPSSHELALGHQRSAEHTVRMSVLALALKSDVLANSFSLHDCASYWGNQHYGCVGLVGRAPEYQPKPAFPMYATLTRMLDTETFEGFVETGSATAYCVAFVRGAVRTYCLWTVRGERDMRVTVRTAGQAMRVDASGNSRPLELDADRQAVVRVKTEPVWIRVNGAIEKAEVGPAQHDEAPAGLVRPLDGLDEPWAYVPGAYPDYASNHWGCARYAGPMRSAATDDPERGKKVWEVALDEPDVKRELAAWYGVFEPKQPVPIPGRARALGVWARGFSNWGRIIYEIEDAAGEVWRSVGKKDDWNCDDTHCWSYFAHDGWRYLEFPLPHHEPGDDYRGMDVVWWSFDREGVVDLPVRLKKIIIEQRTHNIYVDQLVEVPAGHRRVLLSDLVAVYEAAEAMTEAPVLLQKGARQARRAPATDVEKLPNPVRELAARGEEPAATIVKVAPPEHFHDGTRVEVAMAAVDGATAYKVYVSAHESGAGAVEMGSAAGPLVTVTRLRPEMPFYLFATAMLANKKETRPSPGFRVVLKDDFPMK